MKTYISMLRGINVSGQKLIKMPELKRLYEDIGFSGVVTYIQSGNVVFSTEEDIKARDLAQKIEKAVREKFSFDVPVIIRTRDELKDIIAAVPFKNPGGVVPDKVYITFLEDIPEEANVLKIHPLDYKPDRFVILGKEIYLDCASGYGTTKLSNTFFENKLKVRATTRNYNTVNKLIELAEDLTLNT
jgi:uncharacterized protein (DUF1697 family)